MIFALPFFIIIPLLFNQNKPAEKPQPADYMKLVFLGVLGYYASSMLDFMGLQYVTAGLERLILFIYPTIVVILLFVFFKKSIGKKELIALALTYAGILVVFMNDDLLAQKNAGLGALLIFGSAFTYAIYLIGSGRLIPKFGSVRFTAYVMTVSCVSVMMHYLFFHTTSFTEFPMPVYMFGLAIAIISTVIPTFLVSEGIKIIGAGQASIIASIGPIATIVMGYFILHEPITFYEMMGTGLVLTGVLLVGSQK
jgi:drug/metabolite transporter (DMT)-like permease